MKRDCGKGELIPVSFEVVAALFVTSENETESSYPTLGQAERVWQAIADVLKPCTNVRLYAKDKEGYANCILSKYVKPDGMVMIQDRRHEL